MQCCKESAAVPYMANLFVNSVPLPILKLSNFFITCRVVVIQMSVCVSAV